MGIDENTTKIILAIVALVSAILGGSLFAIKKSKNRRNNVKQENITINGSGKVVGGDDRSRN